MLMILREEDVGDEERLARFHLCLFFICYSVNGITQKLLIESL